MEGLIRVEDILQAVRPRVAVFHIDPATFTVLEGAKIDPLLVDAVGGIGNNGEVLGGDVDLLLEICHLEGRRVHSVLEV